MTPVPSWLQWIAAIVEPISFLTTLIILYVEHRVKNQLDKVETEVEEEEELLKRRAKK